MALSTYITDTIGQLVEDGVITSSKEETEGS